MSGTTWAIEKLPGQWSFQGGIGMPILFDSDFYGTWDEFDASYENGELITYPFGDGSIVNLGFAGDLQYRFENSAWSIYFGTHAYALFSEREGGAEIFPNIEASIVQYSTLMNSIGVVYDFGQLEDSWNFALRGGANLAFTSARGLNQFLNSEESHFLMGMGLEFSPVIRYNFEKLPFSLELNNFVGLPIVSFDDTLHRSFSEKVRVYYMPTIGMRWWM